MRDPGSELAPRGLVSAKRNQMLKTPRRQRFFLVHAVVCHPDQMFRQRRSRDLFRDFVISIGQVIAVPGLNEGSGENLGKVVLAGGL